MADGRLTDLEDQRRVLLPVFKVEGEEGEPPTVPEALDAPKVATHHSLLERVKLGRTQRRVQLVILVLGRQIPDRTHSVGGGDDGQRVGQLGKLLVELDLDHPEGRGGTVGQLERAPAGAVGSDNPLCKRSDALLLDDNVSLAGVPVDDDWQ